MFWRGNNWVRLVAIGALGAIVVGGAQYYPDGYVVVPRPACGGMTPEGCSLRWQAVPTMDGGAEAQCVQFCPQGRATILEQQAMGPSMPGPVADPGAVQPVAGPVQQPPAAAPGGQGCEIAVFTAANFGGQSVRTNDSQPNLNEQWDRQILSVQVIAGTWDFFKGEDFSGEAMRLPPGQYGDLGPTWARQISSFMCSEPTQ